MSSAVINYSCTGTARRGAAIELIPAYYGMIWMTPAVVTGSVRQLFNPSAAASKRGTVNVVTKGWLTLWEKIVEKDLQGKIKFNATIKAVERLM